MALEEVGSKIVAEGADAYVSAMGRADDAHGRFVRGVQEGSGKAGSASTAMQGVMTGAMQAVAAVAVTALATAGVAFAKFIGDSVGVAATFESGMNGFEAAAGKSIKAAGMELSDFGDLFIELGKKLPVSTTEVQDAAIALTKGGMDPLTLAGGGLEKSLNFAKAANLGLADAARISMGQMAAYVPITATAAEKNEFLAKSQDLLVKGANAAGKEVDSFGNATQVAAAKAQSTGVAYDDFLVTMSAISREMPSAEEAGTSYKNFLSRLQPTTKEQAALMKDLGIVTKKGGNAFFDATGKFKGNKNAAEVLNKALSGMSDQQKSSTLQTLFGNDAMNSANVLAKLGADGYDQYAATLNGANGVAEQSAATQKGLAFEWENFKGSLEALQIVIGTALMPILSSLVASLSGVVGKVIEFAQGFFSASDKIAFLQNALAGILPAGVNLQEVFSTAGAIVSGAFATIQSAIQTAIPIVMGIVSTVLPELLEVWNTVFNGVRDTVLAAMPIVMSIITSVLASISAFWAQNGADIISTVTSLWSSVKQIVSLAVQVVSAVVLKVLNEIKSWWEAHHKEVESLLTIAWAAIKTVVTTAIELVKGVLKATLQIIQGDWKGAWETIKTTATTIWDNIKTIVSDAIKKVESTMGVTLAQIKQLAETKMNEVKTAFSNAWTAIVNGISEKVSAARNAAAALADGIRSAIDSKIAGIREAILNPIQSAVDGIRNAIQGLWNTFNSLKSAVANFRLPSFTAPTSAAPARTGATSVRAAPSPASVAAGVMRSSTSNYNYNMTVNTRQSVGSIRQDFGILQALAGA